MSDFLLYFAKSLLLFIPASLIISILGGIQFMFLVLLNRLNKWFLTIYLFIIQIPFLNLFFAVFYIFLGACVYKVSELHSTLFNSNWAAHIAPVLGMILLFSALRTELRKEREKFLVELKKEGYHSNVPLIYTQSHLFLSATITSLKGSWIMPLSYILFLFYPDLISEYLFGIPEYFALLWI